MERMSRPQQVTLDSVLYVLGRIPWKLLFLFPLFTLIAIPTFAYGFRTGKLVPPLLASFFYGLESPATVTPVPASSNPLPLTTPVFAPFVYTVQNYDSCSGIINQEMHSSEAGAGSLPLNDLQNQTHGCLLQPGEQLALQPQYPILALGGVVSGITTSLTLGPQPTPLIPVPSVTASSTICIQGCTVDLKVTDTMVVHLVITQTSQNVHIGSWIWTLAVPSTGSSYYIPTNSTLNNMSLSACELQIDAQADQTVTPCGGAVPATNMGGAWVLGIAGAGGLDHWKLALPAFAGGTPVLLWMSADQQGNLSFPAGNQVYTFDAAASLYQQR